MATGKRKPAVWMHGCTDAYLNHAVMQSCFHAIQISLLIIFLSSVLFAQAKKQVRSDISGINQKQSELSQLRDQISSLENELKLKTKKERESFNVLENYNRQSFLLHSLINRLISEEQAKELQITGNEKKQEELQNDIKLLKENYAKYVISVYKHGQVSEWMIVLDADSFEQALLRYKYLQKFSEHREKDLAKLKDAEDSLLTVRQQLENEKEEKIQLTQQKQEDENNLEVKREERKNILKAIKNDKAALLSEIEAKKNAEIKIKSLIDKLIKEAEARKKAEEERLAIERLKKKASKKNTANSKTEASSPDNSAPAYDVDLSTAGFSSFTALRGRLNWPVRTGRIVKKFGENRNEKLNTVTLNYGVDIKASPDENVISVADGVVSAIDWLPGYGSVVIITHKGDYRTVYSHLSNIYVKEGDKVRMGSSIGTVGESLEGNILHFEIWNSRDKQNPEVWLVRK